MVTTTSCLPMLGRLPPERSQGLGHPVQSMPRLPQALLAACLLLPASSSFAAQEPQDKAKVYAATFDAHWKVLLKEYPYFELYGVDWEAERAEHRPKALAADSDTEFAWELARLISSLPDPHVSFRPSGDTILGKWSVPDVDVEIVERRLLVLAWPEGQEPEIPEAFADDPFAYPEIIGVRGQAPIGVAEILVSGPLGTSFDVQLRWPDGTEQEHTLVRPAEANIPPPPKHYGDAWLSIGRVGDLGYLRIRTFDPDKATLGPDGKMTTMLRAALVELKDTESLILDLQGNGGGHVSASDPFLGHFLKRSLSYRWGNAGGKRRVIRPRTPRYQGAVVALVDAGSASGGEWAARILKDAGRATVIGGRTAGAEAAVHTSDGPDGSVVKYSAWPMVEPGRKPFQEVGIALDWSIPLTVEDVRSYGIEEANARVRRARIKKALEVLEAPAGHLEALDKLLQEGRE